MSRSAADATRFTATGPYASSKSGGVLSQLPGSAKKQNGGNNAAQPSAPHTQQHSGRTETAKEKVERLRAQARAARMARSASGMDSWIEIGRRVANKAHKGMVYTLIAASGICGLLTAYSVVSLTLYNRRQRTLWIEREMENLNRARIAYADGTATPEQLEMLKKEKIGDMAKQKREEEKAQRPWNKAKKFLYEKLNMDDAGAAATTAATAATPVVVDEVGSQNRSGGVVDALNAKKAMDAASSKSGVPMPGQLDVMADNAERAAKETTRGWTSWLTGR